MSFKVALDAGHGLYTSGKRCLASIDGNQTREWVLNSRICDKIQSILQGYDGYEILRVDDVSGQTDVPLSTRCAKANSWGATIYLSVHHNAGVNGGAGGGIEVYIYLNTNDSTTISAQNDLYDCLVRHTGLSGNRSPPKRKADFAVLRETSMVAVLAECGFMDSTTDTPIILTDTFAQQVAEAYVEFIASWGALTKKYVEPVYVAPVVEPVPVAPVVEAKQMYRIRLSWGDIKSQIGAYSNIDSAKHLVDQYNQYKVFDNDGNVIYEVVAVAAEPTPEPVAEPTPIVAEPTTVIEPTPIVEPIVEAPIVEVEPITEPTAPEELPQDKPTETVNEVIEQPAEVPQSEAEDTEVITEPITLKSFLGALLALIKIIIKSIRGKK